ncbi:hypothetical protein GCM10025768_03010 [Microbacterium pseudoresistens]|uniref:J domain-containing protein n=1 Tax=Microbacterium pseudoresistens TaxID=640634 RepID=A0A7Y9EUD2_9MICO|nr:hypothetical protein [Microbacterium pseudoresistens]
MFDSPLSVSAYEALGVDAAIDDDGLRRAYRVRLRETHPDTGGDAAVFLQVQRAWELIGSPGERARYDRGHGFSAPSGWSGSYAPAARRGSRMRAQSYGEAGRWHRERYLALVREWAGSASVPDPYAAAFVRTLPRAVRRLLADALAEEETALMIDELGMGFTAWHDVATVVGATASAPTKLDHVVLGSSGLYGVASEDYGGVVGFRGGEIVGANVTSPAPVTALLGRIRGVARTARVRFGGAIVVLPDDDLGDAVMPLGRGRGIPVVVVRRSALGTLLRSGAPGSRVLGGTELFDVRTRLRAAIRFA